VRVTLTHPPCGHCRQFMHEMNKEDCLTLHIVDGNRVASLAELLPFSFKPRDLGQEPRMLLPSKLQFKLMDSSLRADPLVDKALSLMPYAWGPYTSSPSAVAVRTTDGEIYGGVYLENCAYNPTLPPLQACLTGLAADKKAWSEIAEAVLLECVPRSKGGSAGVTQELYTRGLLQLIAPGAPFRVAHVTSLA